MPAPKIHISVDGSVIGGDPVRDKILHSSSHGAVSLVLQSASHDLFNAAVMYIYARSDAHILLSRKSAFKEGTAEAVPVFNV